MYVSFALRERMGHPTETAVAESSGSMLLDIAAIRYANEIVLSAPCLGTRYRMRIAFRLDDETRQPIEPALAADSP